MRRSSKRIIVLLMALGLIAATAGWFLSCGGEMVSFRTAHVTRGDLLISIAATGTIEPEEVIDVGAQVHGRILAFGKDADGGAVDYGSAVEEGTVLAHIDDSLYATEVSQSEAEVQFHTAGLEHAKAELEQARARLFQAERDWERAQKLGPSEALAQISYDTYKSNYQIATASVALGEATVLKAKASLAQAKASLKRAQQNLAYCTIESPVKGVIIDRRVNIGQTVVASLSAPSLFLLAKDLTRMQIWVAVNEADIGEITPGQPVTFTVDAFPNEAFEGQVRKIRLNASMTQNVVTYTVEITIDNSDGRLLPYLTANVQFELERSDDVLLVPNTALNWRPAREQVASAFRNPSKSPAVGTNQGTVPPRQWPNPGPQNGPPPWAEAPGAEMPSGPPFPTGSGLGPLNGDRGVLWVVDGQHVRPIHVRVGLSDGTMTEVQGDGLSEGLDIVTGSQSPSSRRPRRGGGAESGNPFAPKLPKPPSGAGPGGPPQR